MKKGTKVKVIAHYTGHEFYKGEIVSRHPMEYDGDEYGELGFISDAGEAWYMQPEEYEILDKTNDVDYLQNRVKELEELLDKVSNLVNEILK